MAKLKLTNCTSNNCDIGFGFGGNIDVEVCNSHAHDCKAGFLTYGSAEEFDAIIHSIQNNTREYKSLVQEIAKTPPEARKDVILKSKLFKTLSTCANGATILQFLLDLFK